MVYPGASFCHYCKSPLPKQHSPAKAFFLALLKCLGFYGFFLAVHELISIALMIVSICYMVITTGAFDPDAAFDTLSLYQGEIGILACGLIVLGYSLFFRMIKKRFTEEIRVRPVGFDGVLTGVVLGISCLFIVSVGLAALYSAFPELASHSNSEELSEMMGSGNMFVTALSVTVFTGIVEEVLFRGLIYNTLKKAIPRKLAIFVSALIFGAAHMNIEQFFYTALLGVLLCIVYDKFDTIIVPVILHATFNGANYLLGALSFKYDIVYIAMLILALAIFMIFAGASLLSEKVPASRVEKIKGN